MRMTQAQWMRLYNETHREEFNPVFFQRSNKEIMNCVKKVILSCERDKYFTLKVLSMREIYDYEEIINLLKTHDDNTKKKGNKSENRYNYIDINDSAIMMLEVKYFIRHNGTEIIKNLETKKDEVVINPQDIVNVLIVLPRFVNKYYFRLNGNYYTDIFQIVDGSTYNNATNGGSKAPCNTMKTIFTPIRMFRFYRKLKDALTGEEFGNAYYSSIIPLVYNTHVNTMLYMLACFGPYYAQQFLQIDCVQILKEPVVNENYANIEKNNIFISYPKDIANKDPMVQAYVVALYDGIRNDTQYEDMFDIRYWLKLLGKNFGNESIEKGLFILDSLDGIYDIVTREELHLPDEYKVDIYHLLRWLMREFQYIRNKNNVDVSLKRYRIAEPIASIYGEKIITGLLRVSDMGKRVTLMSVKRAIYTHPLYVVNKATTSMNNLIDYRDIVNDNDAMSALKFTYKGKSGLGENGQKIQMTYRYVDPSHAGILDLDSSTTSDPGMSGTICPMAKIYTGNSFSDYEEPNYWDKDILPIHRKWKKNNAPGELINPIQFDGTVEDDKFSSRQQVVAENIEIDKPICPIISVDGSFDYSIAGAKLRESIEADKNVKSLFNVSFDSFKEDSPSDNDSEDDYYEEDDYGF